MNNFKTDINGGLPFRLDDLRFMTAAQMEAFVGVMQAMIGDLPYAILNGCEYSVNEDGSWHINAGYIYFDNEIFYAPAQDLPALTSGGYFWDLNITYDHSGDKTFLLDGVHSTYEVRRAKLNYYDTGIEGTRPPMLSDNMLQILKDRIGVDNSKWVDISLNSSNVSIGASGALSSINGSLKYKIIGKTAFIQVNLSLTVTTSNSDSTAILIILPSILQSRGSDYHRRQSFVFDNSNPPSSSDVLYLLDTIYLSAQLSISSLRNIPLEQRTFDFAGEIFYEIN
jgi:hypothetical protein